MKLKNIFYCLLIISVIAPVFYSCNNNSKNKNAETEKYIKDDKLYPFLLGGVYFFSSYGGVKYITDEIKNLMPTEPGSKDFLSELQNGYEELFIYPMKNDGSEADDAAKMLEEGWDITDKETFLKTCDWLLNEGHQKEYEKCRKALEENGGTNADIANIPLEKYELEDDPERLEFIKNNYGKFSKRGIKAWDYCRYVNNLAMAYSAGYITKEEGYDMLNNKLIPAVHQDYDNWNDYFNDWAIGRKFWSKDDPESFDEVITEMQDTTNLYNIYNYVKFK